MKVLSNATEAKNPQWIEQELNDYGLHLRYICQCDSDKDNPSLLRYSCDATYQHDEFDEDIIHSSIQVEITSSKSDYNLYAISSISMERVYVQYKVNGLIAGAEFAMEDEVRASNCSIMWALNKSLVNDQLLKPHRTIERSLAQVIKGQILKLAKQLDVVHPEKEVVAPVIEKTTTEKKEEPKKKEEKKKQKTAPKKTGSLTPSANSAPSRIGKEFLR